MLYVVADKDIIDKFFLSRKKVTKTYFDMAGPFSEVYLSAIVCEMAQQNGYSGTNVSSLSTLFRSYIIGRVIEINMLAKWLNTPPAELPDDMVEENTDISKSNINYLLSCFTFASTQDDELIRQYFNTFFFEMVMPIYNPERVLSQRSFMLVLVGPENCRKTTFFTMLFPPNLRRQFVTNSTETLGGAKSIRDFSASLVSSALVVTDEFEIFYNKKNDSLFKTLVTSDVIDYVPIYEKTMQKAFKNAVIAGTTNVRSLPFEQGSNRRLAMVDVKWIDTSKMDVINWHHFYRYYVNKGEKAIKEGLYPWKLSDELIQKQYQENEPFRAMTNLEIVMRELFDFDMETHDTPVDYDKPSIQTNIDLYKEKDVVATLMQHYPYKDIKRAELKHVLKRLCGAYTDTVNTRKELKLTKAAGFIKNGIVQERHITRYVMPPIKTDF